MTDDHDRNDPRDPEQVQEQHKKAPNSRPDRPTTSDDATLAERGDGAHAEYAEAPTTMSDNPPPEDEGSSGGGEEDRGDA